MNRIEIVSLPELDHCAELSEAVNQLSTAFSKLQECLDLTDAAQRALCEEEEIPLVSSTATYWQWRASGSGTPEQQSRETQKAIARKLQTRDAARFEYYAAKLRTTACKTSIRPLVAKVERIVHSIRAVLGQKPLNHGSDFLQTELAMINVLLAERLVARVESKLATLSYHYALSTQTAVSADGTETSSPHPLTEPLGPDGQQVNMHSWLQNLYDSFARRYFLHYGVQGTTTSPKAVPKSGLMTLLEADWLLYQFDVCSEYHQGTAELYEVQDGKFVSLGTRFGCFGSMPFAPQRHW